MSEITIGAGSPAPDKAARQTAGAEPLPHYISPAPFDPYSVDVMTAAQERFYRASQWQLMWAKFKDHRLAWMSLWMLGGFYLIALLAPVLAPYDSWKNRIAVLEDGRITATGPHEELLTTSPTYQRLYQLQFMDAPDSAADMVALDPLAQYSLFEQELSTRAGE